MNAICETNKLSEQEIKWNLECAEDAIAQQELEGLRLPKEFIFDLEQAARGEITVDDVVSNIERRYEHVKILKSRPLP